MPKLSWDLRFTLSSKDLFFVGILWVMIPFQGGAAQTAPLPYHLISPQFQLSPYYPEPLVENASRVSTTTTKTSQYIIALTHKTTTRLSEKYNIQFANPKMERLHTLFTTLDTISQIHYQRGVLYLEGENRIEELSLNIVNGRWWKEYLALFTENPNLPYSENRVLRILLALHTSSHFYQLPYPTFFCLLFQESKLNFIVSSQTGALGIGQLTEIAVKQIEVLRKNIGMERLLQATTIHLRNIYRDPILREIFEAQGFSPRFPKLGKFPATMTKPNLVDAGLMHEVSRQLLLEGYSYGRKTKLIRQLIDRINRGGLLNNEYAAVQRIYTEELAQRYNQEFGNVLNIETNIILSAMLFQYYMDYEWRVKNKVIELHPDLRTIAAIAAYNQGQTVVLRLLGKLMREFPQMDLSKASLKTIGPLLTTKRIHLAMGGGPFARVQELHQHIWKINRCSHNTSTL
ncbi:hypothetical protein WDW89_00635 [Deltaproteobacteria bacterium TL4]